MAFEPQPVATLWKHSDGTLMNAPASCTSIGLTSSSAQTGITIKAPAAGNSLYIAGYQISASGTADGNLRIFSDTDAAANWIFNGRFDVSVNAATHVNHSISPPRRIGTDKILKFTTDSSVVIAGVIYYFEDK